MQGGISAACVTGEIKKDPVLETRVLNGEFRLLFIGPESLLQNPLWREMVQVPIYRTRLVAMLLMKHIVLLNGNSANSYA